MSVSSALLTGLYATRARSDYEMKIQFLANRRLALTNLANEAGELSSQAIWTPDPSDDQLCLALTALIHQNDKDLESKMQELQTELKIMEQMEESAMKKAKENAKSDFTVVA